MQFGERLDGVREMAGGKAGAGRHVERAVDVPSGPRATSIVFGPSVEMGRLRELVDLAARFDSKVLLQGETGTGKGLVAREIHRRSRRRSGRFVHVDCAALSPSLIESELFGHEKGAFTGATASRKGRFELAEDGTLFLDEVGDLHLSLQSKLLRVLEDRTYERVGGTESLPMKARIIAATRRDLWAAVRAGRFREDLFFRLNVVCVHVPSLRDRIEDVPIMIRAGLERLSESLGVSLPRVSDEFCTRLMDYSWPGNVRELMNVLERLLVEGKPVLESHDLEGLLPAAASTTVVPRYSGDEDDEVSTISAALVETGGVVARTARRLGMPRSSLRYKIKRYRLGHLIPND